MQILVGRQNTMRAERRYGFHLLENEPLENERHPQCQISIQGMTANTMISEVPVVK